MYDILLCMWNLIKNVFRSLRRNKASVVGLTFLVFLSIGIFTILNSVSSNIGNEYARITTSGNLHDFTISENYVIGNAIYDFKNNPTGGSPSYMGKSSDGYYVPWPVQTGPGDDGKYTRTYQVSLNVDGQDETLLGMFYKNHNSPNDPYYSLLHTIVNIENTKELTYINDSPTHTSDKNNE